MVKRDNPFDDSWSGERIIKILIEDKPKDSNISEEQIKILANTILKNYLTKKEIN